MRLSGAAAGLAIFFACFITVSSAVPCPFLSQPEKPAMPCCPGEHRPSPQCPLSTSIEACPFFISESKIGQTVAHLALPFVAASTIAAPPPVATNFVAQTVPVTLTDRSDTYLLNRILRI